MAETMPRDGCALLTIVLPSVSVPVGDVLLGD
jgi:hypothetical protein